MLTATLQGRGAGSSPRPAAVMVAGPTSNAVPEGTGDPQPVLGGAVKAGTERDKRDGGMGYGLSSVARGWAGQQQAVHEQAKEPSRQSQTGQPSYGIDADSAKTYQPASLIAGQKRKFTEARDTTSGDVRDAPAPPSTLDPEYSDIIDRGVIDMQKAAELFHRYNEHMVQHLPAVVFRDGTAVAELRQTMPILFLAVMAASSSETPDLQRQLVRELMQIFAEEIIITGEKSLELVQALHVAVIWYWPPDRLEELKFYQLLHIAAVMAIDIGLGRKNQGRGAFKRHLPHPWRDHSSKKHRLADPTSMEGRRTWLTCYFLATNAAMVLHRPNLVRWTPFMTECMDILESSPEAAPTDRYLCHLVWMHRLAEDVGIQFSMDDPTATINLADARIQYALRGFERDLEKYSGSISADMQRR
jgi:hypothetical protein